MRTIGASIRYYRCLHHLTQEKLAELADINEKSISAYENDMVCFLVGLMARRLCVETVGK